MKRCFQLILGLAALLLLGASAWWLKTTRFTPPIHDRTDSANPLAPNHEPVTTPIIPTPAGASALQPNTASGGKAVPRKKIDEMELSEAGAIMAEIRKRDIAGILKAFLEAENIEHDSMKQQGVLNALAYALHERKPDQVSLNKLQGFIEDASNSDLERGMVIGALSQASTKETAELLLHLASTLKNKNVRDSAIGGVGGLVREGGDETLTPMLNRTWTETTDPHMIDSGAEAMGRTGAASSVELLLAAALAPDGKDDERREAAISGLARVWTENAVPPLAALLGNSAVGSKASDLAFGVLLNTTGEEGPQAVLKWLQNADNSAAPMAKVWFEHIRNADTQVKPMEAALDSKMPFRSEENRKALRECLEAYRAGRKFLEGTSSNKDAVVGFLTTSSLHKGSQMGRVYEWLKWNKRPPKGSNQDWDTANFLRSPTYRKLGVDWQNKDTLDVRRPVIMDMDDRSQAISDLNAQDQVARLPAKVRYGEILYANADLGLLLRGSLKGYSVFHTAKAPTLSVKAREYLIGHVEPKNLKGDGLIPVDKQWFTSLPGFPAPGYPPADAPATAQNTIGRLVVTDREVVHTEAPSQVDDIRAQLRLIVPDWFP